MAGMGAAGVPPTEGTVDTGPADDVYASPIFGRSWSAGELGRFGTLKSIKIRLCGFSFTLTAR